MGVFVARVEKAVARLEEGAFQFGVAGAAHRLRMNVSQE
jgi:hypothetical protein